MTRLANSLPLSTVIERGAPRCVTIDSNAGHLLPCQGLIGDQAHAFPCELIHDGQNPKPPTVGDPCTHEVHASPPIRCHRAALTRIFSGPSSPLRCTADISVSNSPASRLNTTTPSSFDTRKTRGLPPIHASVSATPLRDRADSDTVTRPWQSAAASRPGAD
jgi:hypothetical protein